MLTFLPIVICFVCYTLVGIGNAKQGDYPHAMIWWAYALSQLGFIWYEYTKLGGTHD